MSKIKKQLLPKKFDKVEFETFYDIGNYEINNLKQEQPSTFNGMCRIRKLKVTIELVEEPIDIIHARLEEVWLHCDNWHNRECIEAEARRYNYTFKGDFGSLVIRK
jgi:hypothetical protein